MEDVETQINGQVPAANVAEANAVEIETNGEATEGEGLDDVADDNDPSGDVDKELKTVRKALDKRNRYISNQRNRIRTLETEIQKMRDGFGKDKVDAPDLEKFDSVLDYMKAENAHTLDQRLAEQENKQKIAELERQRDSAFQQQVQEIDRQVQTLLSSNPAFRQIMTGNAALIQQMPPQIENLVAELDDSPAAIYALAKEGRLQDLYSMPPHIAAAHLVQAEFRGQQYLQQPTKPRQATTPQTPQAPLPPKPIGTLKGTGKTGKSVKDMSPDEIVQRYIK